MEAGISSRSPFLYLFRAYASSQSIVNVVVKPGSLFLRQGHTVPTRRPSPGERSRQGRHDMPASKTSLD
jgi:hypothetical protein